MWEIVDVCWGIVCHCFRGCEHVREDNQPCEGQTLGFQAGLSKISPRRRCNCGSTHGHSQHDTLFASRKLYAYCRMEKYSGAVPHTACLLRVTGLAAMQLYNSSFHSCGTISNADLSSKVAISVRKEQSQAYGPIICCPVNTVAASNAFANNSMAVTSEMHL